MDEIEKERRRLVVLGCGYLGREIVRQGLDAGYAVTALTRNATKASALKASFGLDTLVADLAGDEWHHQINPQGASIVLCVSSGGGGEAGYRHAYEGSIESIHRWLTVYGPAEQIVYTGSTSVYPQVNGEWVTEASPVYGSTVLNEILCRVEERVLELKEAHLVKQAFVLRLAGIYGPGRHYLIDTLKEGKTTLPGRGDYYLNLIHRDDAARAIIMAMNLRDEGVGGIYNIADGQPAEKRIIAEWTAAQLEREPPVFDPEQVSERAKRRSLNPGGIPHRRICVDKARTEWGWQPVYPSFREGYQAILEGLSSV